MYGLSYDKNMFVWSNFKKKLEAKLCISETTKKDRDSQYYIF